MYTVYVLINKESKIYVGQTNDIERRLNEHNNDFKGKIRRYTKNKGPWILKLKEEYKTRSESIKRERFLKSHKGRELIRSFGPVAQW